jgi:hypothetical protein
MASITRVGMVLGLGLALGWAGFAVGAAGQEAAQPKPKVSDQALSAEQLAIYKLILKGWMDNGKHAVHLGIQTDPFPLDELTGDQSCGKGLSLEAAQNVVHRFRAEDLARLGSSKIELVDVEKQAQEVRENDPEKSIRGGKSIAAAVSNGFAHGLVTVSEIRFDEKHEHAIVWYGFVCGSLCGNGGTVMLVKENGVWKRGQNCSNWIS